MTTHNTSKDTRPVGWVRAARKAHEGFPKAVRDRVNMALTIAAEGGKADIAKPLNAFQKKSKTGVQTPKTEIDLVRARLGRLREELLR